MRKRQHAGTADGLPAGTDGADADRVGQLLGMISAVLAAVGDIQSQLCKRQKDLYTVEEVAALARRSPYTVRTWVKDGLITATRVTGTGPRGRLLIARTELSKITHAGLGEKIPAGAAD